MVLILLFVSCLPGFSRQALAADNDEQVVPLLALATTAKPGSDELPLQYLGPDLPDKEAPDGRLRYSPGVQNIQVARANRKYPPPFPEGTENEKGWTYQHHVGMGEWKGKLYGVWDMTHVGEDNPPVRVVYATSDDGFNWTQPKDLYPFNKAYNSRFYFFHSSNGRMLVFASGWYPTDNVAEDRKVRLYVREITSEHKLGKIYTLIKPAQGHPPAYTESRDAGFLRACREVLNNKPLLEQADYGILLGDKKMKWHEGKNWPGGKIPSIGGDLWIFGKSMCFYHRADGVLVGTCKIGWVTQSRDEGETWSFPTIPRGIKGGGGKTWAQATPDGRYTMIYIPQDVHRYPMAITTSDDGITFRDMRVIHGEVPPQRYEGRAKPLGPQYLRGLSEWGSDGSRNEKGCIWTIYSMSKEDIWVSRVPVPIVAEGKHANDTFDKISVGPRVPEWNTYSPIWAPVSIAAKGSNHYLQLEDREPADYARAIRTFPVSKTADISFRVAAAQTDRGRLEIELLGELGSRPIRLTLNDKGRIQAVDGRQPATGAFESGLSGTYFNKADFRDPDDEVDVLGNLHQSWGDSKGNDWSARWTGFIEAPYSGVVTFSAEATDGLRLKIGEKVVIDGLSINGARTGKVTMTKGQKTPITMAFTSAQGKAKLVLSWSWAGHRQSIVPAAALSHKVPPRLEPVNLMAYKANNWLDCSINADCKTGSYTLKVNGREVLKDAGFAEPSSMVYALSFRTGEYRGKPTGRAEQDIPNTEEPLEKVTYRIDDVLTGMTFGAASECGAERRSIGPQPYISIIPEPVALEQREGQFLLTPKTYIVAQSKARAEAMKLIDCVEPAMGHRLKLVEDSPRLKNVVRLRIEPSLKVRLGEEGYELVATHQSIAINAGGPAGLFYGIQTLRQLLPPAIFSKQKADGIKWTVPCVHITDHPRFKWRGLLIDPARHFIPKQDVKRFIDVMAVHKFNRLQVHLTDNEGWRIEIKKYPKLAELGSKMDWNLSRKGGTGPRCFGFYTQHEIREIVRYAADRHITIVPEIEMPFHTGAAIVSYPELGINTGHLADLPPEQRWGKTKGLIAPRPETVAFLQDVLSEVIELFPSKEIHIGGDEANTEHWARNPEMQAQMKRLKLKDAHELHSWFIKQMDTFLTKKGRRLVGWDEILQGGLAPGATVMSWRGTKGGIAAAKAGHDVVMAPTSHTYFDYRQAPKETGLGRSVINVQKVYTFEPIPTELNAEQARHILGGQGQLWGELISDYKRREFMAFPRACALSEVLWSPRGNRSFKEFLSRLLEHRKRLKAAGVNYRPLDRHPCVLRRHFLQETYGLEPHHSARYRRM